MAQAFARKFYSSKAWQDCRNEYIKSAHYLCEECLRKGIYKPAEIVHHIIELDPINIERPEVSLNWDNLEALCRGCHSEKHPKARGQWSQVNKKKRERRDQSNRYVVGPNGEVSSR